MKMKPLCAAVIAVALLSGCATTNMAPVEQDTAMKAFQAPPQDKASLYIYRNSFAGQALKKTVSIDGKIIGETANKTYFHSLIAPGVHTLSTESEFSDNAITLDAKPGETYFVRQMIKMGVFAGGAKLEVVPQSEGREGVLESKLAASQ